MEERKRGAGGQRKRLNKGKQKRVTERDGEREIRQYYKRGKCVKTAFSQYVTYAMMTYFQDC